jgi:minor extracellular serine protease Vpr
VKTRFIYGRLAVLSAFLIFVREPSGTHSASYFRALDPGLRDRLFEYRADGRYGRRPPPAGSDFFRAFIRTRNPAGLGRRGVRVETVLRDIATAAVRFDAVDRLMSDPDVTWIDDASPCRPLLDVSLKSAGVLGADGNRIRYGGVIYTGKGVIVGIVDTGIDWSHGDFISPLDGSSRILRMWDQTDFSGRTPDGFDSGTEYLQSQLSDEIRGLANGRVRSRDVDGHGTHVAGIACGNGRATGNGYPSGRYAGVAPEADLIVVKVPEIFDSDAVVSGIHYIFSRADSLGRPAVVNVSLGAPTQEGPHDGSSAFEQAVDRMLGEPGKAIVTAAGNDGDKSIHFRGEFGSADTETTRTVMFRIASNRAAMEDYINLDVWYWPVVDLAVSVIGPSGEVFGPVSSLSSRFVRETPDGLVDVDNASSGPNPGNGDRELRIRISDDYRVRPGTETLVPGDWKLAFTGKWDAINRRPGVFDGWLYDTNTGAEITEGAEDSRLIAEPGNARLCITVGCYTSRTEWPGYAANPFGPGGIAVDSMSASSSPGPPRQNFLNSASTNKPELAGPGEYVLSSRSKFMNPAPDPHFLAADGVHLAMHGTSMSAPHVTGVIALLLQANPNLDSYSIKRILINGAKKVKPMGGNVWDKHWGYGILDADAVMRSVTSVEADANPVHPSGFHLSPSFPNPFNSTTVIRLAVPETGGAQRVTLAVLDLKGRTVRLLHQGALSPGEHSFSWDGIDDRGGPVPGGVYVCRLSSADAVQVRKLCFLP